MAVHSSLCLDRSGFSYWLWMGDLLETLRQSQLTESKWDDSSVGFDGFSFLTIVPLIVKVMQRWLGNCTFELGAHRVWERFEMETSPASSLWLYPDHEVSSQRQNWAVCPQSGRQWWGKAEIQTHPMYSERCLPLPQSGGNISFP